MRKGLKRKLFQLCIGERDGVVVADTDDCQRYYECQNRQAIQRQCRAGQNFDPDRSMCISANAVNCAGRGSASNKHVMPPVLDSNGRVSRHVS
jgi:Chitin binding Peritrophin-A domain